MSYLWPMLTFAIGAMVGGTVATLVLAALRLGARSDALERPNGNGSKGHG